MSDIKINIPFNDKDFTSDRYKIFSNGYKVDRWIMSSCFGILLLFLYWIVAHNNYEMDYFKCGDNNSSASYDEITKTHNLVGISTSCKNPFYKQPSWKNQEYVPYGTYGKDPTPYIRYAWVFTIFIFVLGFMLNHGLYNLNRGKRQ